MENTLNIVYREPELEDAKKIVDFYNYVGGETTFLSFENNVNNLTQSTTTYSVSFNWHGIPCAFLYS